IHQTRPGGYIYISIPTINRIHGEPHFYSSGYHPRFLERLALKNGLDIENIGYWGSLKYLLNAVTGFWLTHNQLAAGPAIGDMIHGMEHVDGRANEDRYITDCWALFRKPVAA